MNFEQFPITREISKPPFRGMVVVDSIVDRFFRDGGRVEELLSGSSSPLKESKSTRTALLRVEPRFPSAGGAPMGGGTVFLKEYLFKNLVHSIKPLFCDHRAKIVWDLSWHLLSHGIPVPAPGGYLIEWKGPFCVAGYFFSEFIPESSHLAAAADMAGRRESGFDFGALIESIAIYVALLHESGVLHGDLKWTNVLVHESGTMFWFVDLDSARFCGANPSVSSIAPDIARFTFGAVQVGVDRSIIELFLDRYARERNLARTALSEPVEKIVSKLRKRHGF